MEGCTIYCTYDALNEIFDKQSTFEEVNELIFKYSNVCLNISDEELDKIEMENFYIKALMKRESLSLVALKDFFTELDDDTDISIKARDIFIINRPISECDYLSKKFGVFVINESDLYRLNLLKDQFQWYLSSERGHQNWADFLEGRLEIIMNSLIIIDNYLLTEAANEIIANLSSFLKAILPKHIGVPFQILILSTNPKNLYSIEKLQSLKKELEFSLQCMSYKICFTIVTHSDTRRFHQRCIITNYHFITSHYGYLTFKNNKLSKRNDLEIRGICFSMNSFSDPTFFWIQENLREVAGQIKECLDYQKTSLKDYYLIVGNCDNRLLQYH